MSWTRISQIVKLIDLHPIENVFILKPTQILWEAFGYYCVKTIHSHNYFDHPHLIDTTGWTAATRTEQNCPTFETAAKGMRTQVPSIECWW